MRWDSKTYKERLHHRLKQIRSVKIWQLVVLLLLSVLVAATFLRLNSLNMSDLRRAVITADESGDAASTGTAVGKLGAYVTTHMNTELGDGFYLSGAYERARQAAVQAAAGTSNPDSALYQKASEECQSATARAPYGGYIVPCVLDKVKKIGGSDTLVSELKLPASELYRINFVSPVWSLDPAGITVAISALLLIVIIARITGVIVLRLLLKRRFQNI